MLRAMPAKLFAVPGSHPCVAVARALELKGIAYETTYLVPVFHKLAQRARFGKPGTVPGIVFEDGEKLLGSTPILRELDRRVPDPPLWPADPERRQLVKEAEEWGEELLQPLTRRLLWWGLGNEPKAQLSFLGDAKLFPPTPRALAGLAGRPVAGAERRINDSGEGAVRADLASLPGHLDRVDRWIERGVIGGDEINAADLQIASSLRLLMTVDDLQPLFSGRPCSTLALRLFPSFPGRVPAGALPAA